MRTRFFKSVLLALALMAALPASAYDFMVDDLCYDRNSNGTSVTVTYETLSWPSYTSLSGAITIPETVTYSGTTYSVTSIGERAFYGCSGLTSVTIPNSVTSIGDQAFDGCSGLTSIVVAQGNTVYDSRNNCNAIIETASNTLIVGCQNTIIPNSVTTIGDYAFRGCSGLTSVTIPNSVTTIGYEAFRACDGLTSVTWNAVNCSSNGSMFTSNIERVTIGNQVQTLPSGFVQYSKITEVTIPNSVTSIGDRAFDGCSGLTSVTIGNSVTSIGGYAFRDCRGLTSVSIPNSVTSIGRSAFDGCRGLTSVTIPNSVTSIGGYAFRGCSGLTSVTWNAKNCSDFSSSLDSPFDNLTNIQSFTFGDEVEHIPVFVCYGLSGLTSVTIPNSVTSIGGSAFSGCSGLTSVTIGNSVTSIGGSAFPGCSGLTSVTWNAKNCSDFSSSSYSPFYNLTNIQSFIFGDGVEHIPAYVCYGCGCLTSVTIPNSVTSIGDYAFEDCSGLTSVVVAADNAIYDSRKDCNAIIETAKNKLVAGCKATVVPNDVDSIAPYAFHGCTGLTHIHIPNSVASIGEYAFEECVGLQSIRLGTSLNEIGNYAFEDCSNLKAIYNARIRPAAIYFDKVFYGVDRNTCVLYVPRGYSQIYWANADWNRFKIIEEWDPDDDPQDFEPGDVNGDGIVSGADVTALYNVLLDGATVAGSADVNGDGVVSGADVTALYNLLLN